MRRFGAAAAGVAAIAAIGAVVLAREEVVRLLPGTARLYAGVGFPVNPRGLEFRGVRSELTTEAGNATLVVEGEIANVVRRGRAVPPVTVAIRNTGGQPLYTWTLDPPRHRLDAGESVPFRSRVATPPAEGFDVIVRFGKAPDRLAEAR